MMYFLDTTFIVALFVSNDDWHPHALDIFQEIKIKQLTRSKLFSTVTITVLKNKLKTKDILEIYRNIPNFFNIVDDSGMYDEAMNIFVKYDSTISFFDAMYVTVMEKEEITKIVSFDSDFDKIDKIARIH